MSMSTMSVSTILLEKKSISITRLKPMTWRVSCWGWILEKKSISITRLKPAKPFRVPQQVRKLEKKSISITRLKLSNA